MEKSKKLKLSLSTIQNISISSGARETVSRYGSAAAEFIKAYTGVDNEKGVILAKGLKKISEHKVDPGNFEKNTRQQAGFSAEVMITARRNSENIIKGVKTRAIRSDDHKDFGKNHQVYDIVNVRSNGTHILESGSQVKFIKDVKKILREIAQGKGGGKSDKSRYQGIRLDLPSDQVAEAIAFCEERAESLRKQAENLEKQGKIELAAQKRADAANYDTLKGNIRDSGLTRDQALDIRLHPQRATAVEIIKTSHQAGLQGAKIGGLVGGAISAVTNVIAVHQGNKELEQAILDSLAGTAKAAAMGYGTAFAGSAVKSFMQQSANTTTRSMARTSLPSLVVTVCLEVGKAVTQYVRGEINEVQFLEIIGERGSGLLASGLFTVIGQTVIPIPIVGAAIGGMVGYTLSSILYHDALSAFKEAQEARENYLAVKEYCEESRKALEAYRLEFRTRFIEWLDEGRAEIAEGISCMDAAVISGRIDDFAAAANGLANLMGKTLQFDTRSDFDSFMGTDDTLVF